MISMYHVLCHRNNIVHNQHIINDIVLTSSSSYLYNMVKYSLNIILMTTEQKKYALTHNNCKHRFTVI